MCRCGFCYSHVTANFDELARLVKNTVASSFTSLVLAICRQRISSPFDLGVGEKTAVAISRGIGALKFDARAFSARKMAAALRNIFRESFEKAAAHAWRQYSFCIMKENIFHNFCEKDIDNTKQFFGLFHFGE